MNRLADKVAVITGGNSGVGAEMAKLFADEGAKVVISARRMDKLEDVANEIRESGGEVLPVRCDIAKAEDADHLMEGVIREFGQIDILVNNAGILESGMKPIDKADLEDISRILDTNLKGTMYITRAAVRYMEENGGAIVNIASVAGVFGCGPAAYAAAKGGVIALTKHTAFRYCGKGIRANVICPGTIQTPMSANASHDELDPNMMAQMYSHLDLKAGLATSEDIANIALFLASDESRAMTGQVLVADFGSSL